MELRCNKTAWAQCLGLKGRVCACAGLHTVGWLRLLPLPAVGSSASPEHLRDSEHASSSVAAIHFCFEEGTKDYEMKDTHWGFNTVRTNELCGQRERRGARWALLIVLRRCSFTCLLHVTWFQFLSQASAAVEIEGLGHHGTQTALFTFNALKCSSALIKTFGSLLL